MDEYMDKILNYLPIEFADDESNVFVKYLEETYLENVRNQKYQFAFIAFHMLYMTFCYKTKWFLKTQNNKLINQTLQKYITTHKNAFFNVLFDLSRFKEKETFESLLNSLRGFNSNDVDNCKIHVTKRNHCSHDSGKIEYKENDIDYFISDEIKYVEKIQNKIQPDLLNFFESFLNDNWNKSIISGDIEDNLRKNNISVKDLELIVNINLSLFKKRSDSEKIIFQKILYLIFVSAVQKYIETEKNLFLEKLPMFMFELKNEVTVKRNGEEKIISIQEIIEENLIPIISNLTDLERKEAEKILNL